MPDLAYGTAIRSLVALVAALCLAMPARAADDPFRVDGAAAQRVVITARSAFDPALPLATPMARTITGVLAELDPAGRRELAKCVVDPGRRGPWRRVPPVAFIHLVHETSRVTLEVLPGEKVYWLHRPGDFNTEGTLDPKRFNALIRNGTRFRGSLETPATAPQAVALKPPFVAGAVTMDRRTMRHRIYRGMRVLNQPADRTLDSERFHVRVPAGYDPRTPAGLVVWASPTPRGAIPRLFDSALDDGGLLAVGVDNAGNDRDVQDKFQLMFDAVETVSRRYHVDPRRVYIVGMSGGGKVASILTTCFPEVFRGGMAVVGLASHHELGKEWEQHQHAYFSRPQGQVLQMATARPIAVLSGPRDYNYREMKVRSRLMVRDGFSLVEFFEDETMGHELPPPGLFRRGLEFVDGPWKIRRQVEIDAATRLLRGYLAQRPDDPRPRTVADRRILDAVMETGPFTGAAWRAWELLAPTMAERPR